MSLSLLLAGAVVGVVLVETVIRRSDVGAALVLGLLVVEETSLFDLTVTAGPFAVFPGDLLFVVLLTGATARSLRSGHLSPAQKLVIGLLVLVLWSLLRGADLFGLADAVNEGRKYLSFTAAALYFCTVEPRREVFDRIGRLWLWAAAVLCGLTLVRWGGNTAGIAGGLFGDGGSLRVLPSAAALVVAQAALLGLPALRDRQAGLLHYVTPVLLVFVVLLQHRTVWVVAAGGTVYLLFRERALQPRALTALCAGLAVFAALTFTVFDDAEDGVANQLSSSATRTGTFEWRFAGWETLVKESGPQGPAEAVLGRPFGDGWARVLDGQLVDVSPHNFYVETYLRLGVAGVAGLLGLYAIALRRPRGSGHHRIDVGGLLSRHVLVTVVAVQLLYYVTYTPNEAQAMLLGLGCAAVSARSVGERPSHALTAAAR